MEVQEFLNMRCLVQLMEIRWEGPEGLLGPVGTLDDLILFSEWQCSKIQAEVFILRAQSVAGFLCPAQQLGAGSRAGCKKLLRLEW